MVLRNDRFFLRASNFVLDGGDDQNDSHIFLAYQNDIKQERISLIESYDDEKPFNHHKTILMKPFIRITETYLEPSRTSTMKLFCENSLTILVKVRVGLLLIYSAEL